MILTPEQFNYYMPIWIIETRFPNELPEFLYELVIPNEKLWKFITPEMIEEWYNTGGYNRNWVIDTISWHLSSKVNDIEEYNKCWANISYIDYEQYDKIDVNFDYEDDEKEFKEWLIKQDIYTSISKYDNALDNDELFWKISLMLEEKVK